MKFRIDLKLVLLAFVVLCLALEAHGLWGSRSRGGSRSVRSWRGGGRRYGGSRVRSVRRYRRVRVGHRVRRINRRIRRRVGHRVRRINRRIRRRFRVRHRVRRINRRIRRRFRVRHRVRRINRRIRRRVRRRVRRINRKIRRRFRVRRFNRRVRRRLTRRLPHTISSKKKLTKLYNTKVVSVQRVERPLQGWLGKYGIKHSGVIVTTASGKRYLIHKGKRFGAKSQTVVVDPKYMSNKWKATSKQLPVKPGTTIGKFVKVGGKYYSWWRDNCHHASKRMCKLG